MTRNEFDFDVIGGPTQPPLASLLQSSQGAQLPHERVEPDSPKGAKPRTEGERRNLLAEKRGELLDPGLGVVNE